MLSEGLHSYLAANDALKTQLGIPRTDKSSGVFPTIAPDQVPQPYIVFQQITGEPLQTSFQGTGRLQTSRWRFSCYGSTYKIAKRTAQLLIRAMEAFDGPAPAGNVEIHGSWLKLEADDAEPIPHGTLYGTHVDFEINWLDYDDA